jgi:uncharacterized metal-binding protein YceD (DUF177 family)
MTKVGRKKDENHALAKLTGQVTYESEHVHSRCGTTTRYTVGGTCVACALARQRAMRQALRNAPLTNVSINIVVDDKALDATGPEPIYDEEKFLDDLI